MKKKIFFFFLAIEIGIIAVALNKYLSPRTNQSAGKTTQIKSFDPYLPPTDSLTGQVITSAGEFSWQSREATQTARVTSLKEIHQGEKIETGPAGTVTFQFKNDSLITLSKDTTVSVIQTLPQNLLFNQTAGSTIYKTSSLPLSVRSLHLLVDMTKAEIVVTTEAENNLVIVKVNSGEITIGYNDNDLKSHTLKVLEKQQLIFNDDTREIILKKN